jgi:hypothetical protein
MTKKKPCTFVPGSWGHLAFCDRISWLWSDNMLRLWNGSLGSTSKPPRYLVLGHQPGLRLILLDSSGHVWTVEFRALRRFVSERVQCEIFIDDLSLHAVQGTAR